MVLGITIVAWCSKNDLELFASHCFLGKDYGSGNWIKKTSKNWMTTKPWPWLRYAKPRKNPKEAPDRFERQQVALLRMISGFSVWTGFTQEAPGCSIYPANVPPNASFFVIVEIRAGKKVETYAARIWPNAKDGDQFIWAKNKPGTGSQINVWETGNIEVRVEPRNLKKDVPIKYHASVRLDLDGRDKNFLPVWPRYSALRSWTGARRTTGDLSEPSFPVQRR
jgi:hypothetical protein